MFKRLELVAMHCIKHVCYQDNVPQKLQDIIKTNQMMMA